MGHEATIQAAKDRDDGAGRDRKRPPRRHHRPKKWALNIYRLGLRAGCTRIGSTNPAQGQRLGPTLDRYDVHTIARAYRACLLSLAIGLRDEDELLQRQALLRQQELFAELAGRLDPKADISYIDRDINDHAAELAL